MIPTIHEKCCGCWDTKNCIQFYRRFRNQRQIVYHSLAYTKRQSSMSYFVKYGSFFGAIIVFIHCNGKQYAIINRYSIKKKFSDYLISSNYYNVLLKSIDSFFFVLEKQSHHVDITDIISITDMCILIEEENSFVVSPISSSHEHD